MTPPYFNTYQSSYNNPQLQQQFLSSQFGSILHNQHYSSTYPLQPQFNYSSIPLSYPYQSQMNHQTSSVRQIAYQSAQVTTQPMTESPLMDSGLPRIQENKPLFKMAGLQCNKFKGDKVKVILVLGIRVMLLALGETMQVDRKGLLNATTVKVNDIWLGKALSLSDQGMQHGIRKKAMLAEEVPHSETYLNDMVNQSVHAIQDFKQTPAVDFSDNEIYSDSNIISLSEDFGKSFTPQQEIDVEHAFWFCTFNPTIESIPPPVKVEVPYELPQTVIDQMDTAVQQFLVDKQCLEIAKKELFLENDRLLQQIMSQDVLLTVLSLMSLIDEYVNVDRKPNKSCNKCFNLDAELLKSQTTHNDLLKRCSQLKKHCISLESSIQLNHEIFQKDESCDNQNALEILEFFEKDDLKAQLEDKDTTICKLKDIIKSLREKSKGENVNYDYVEIETKNVELENSVAKRISKNEHLCNKINNVK
nr:hypothetical protein [Tanacetum cinerariifolium]